MELLRLIYIFCLGLGFLMFVILVEPAYIGIRDAGVSMHAEYNAITILLWAAYMSGVSILIYSIAILYMFLNQYKALLVGGLSVIGILIFHFIIIGFVGHGNNGWLYFASAVIEISIQYAFIVFLRGKYILSIAGVY